MEESKQLRRLLCQPAFLLEAVLFVKIFGDRRYDRTNLHDVDAALCAWTYGNVTAADMRTYTLHLVRFIRRYDEGLNTLIAETQCHK